MRDENLSITLNVGIHMIILFIFLTLLFFLYIKNVEIQSVEKQLKNFVAPGTISFLDEINKYTKQLPTTQQSAVWNGILATSEAEIPKYSQPSEYVTSNNNNVIKTTILINCIVCFVIFSLILLFKYILNKGINMQYILSQNFVLFFLIGILEFVFFITIVHHYIPSSPDKIYMEVTNKIEEYINDLSPSPASG